MTNKTINATMNSKDTTGTFTDLLGLAFQVPGITIDRELFLRRELKKYYSKDIVLEAIRTTPFEAGISVKTIDKIADRIIESESAKLGIASAVVSIPGGCAAIGAVTVDSINYCAFSIRVIQELAYLYGLQELNLRMDENDAETMNTLLIFMGTMFGVQQASRLVKQLMENYSKYVAKNMARKHLTKGLIYPIVKKICKEIGVKMTKQIFADSVASAIPFAGGVLSGGMSYFCFSASCHRLKKVLEDNII